MTETDAGLARRAEVFGRGRVLARRAAGKGSRSAARTEWWWFGIRKTSATAANARWRGRSAWRRQRDGGRVDCRECIALRRRGIRGER